MAGVSCLSGNRLSTPSRASRRLLSVRDGRFRPRRCYNCLPGESANNAEFQIARTLETMEHDRERHHTVCGMPLRRESPTRIATTVRCEVVTRRASSVVVISRRIVVIGWSVRHAIAFPITVTIWTTSTFGPCVGCHRGDRGENQDEQHGLHAISSPRCISMT